MIAIILDEQIVLGLLAASFIAWFLYTTWLGLKALFGLESDDINLEKSKNNNENNRQKLMKHNYEVPFSNAKKDPNAGAVKLWWSDEIESIVDLAYAVYLLVDYAQQCNKKIPYAEIGRALRDLVSAETDDTKLGKKFAEFTDIS